MKTGKIKILVPQANNSAQQTSESRLKILIISYDENCVLIPADTVQVIIKTHKKKLYTSVKAVEVIKGLIKKENNLTS